MIVTPDECTFIRTFSGINVDDVISEIEVLWDEDLQVLSEVIV